MASETAAAAEALVPRFKMSRVLNQDQAGGRIALYGSIDGQPALLVLERAPFPTAVDYLASVSGTLRTIKNLGANDIYYWFLGGSGDGGAAAGENADLKINLIFPCTEQHVKKYSKQGVRFVTETPEIYRDKIRPFMLAKREAGRLNWVFNIIDGVKEADDVIYRTPSAECPPDERFLLLPDLNWDRRTVEALHLMCLVERRDIWSLRDLRKRHVPWLLHMRDRLLDAAVASVNERHGPQQEGVQQQDQAQQQEPPAASRSVVERDQLKLYVHYQPTYYHFHIHIVHVQLEAGATQATGKAVGLESIIAQLEAMAGGDDVGMDSIPLSYALGEASELWTEVFEPLKRRALESATASQSR